MRHQYRGRAALQRRVKLPKSARASATVVEFCVYNEFFRTLFSRAVKGFKIPAL
jgi:hypothetical protein